MQKNVKAPKEPSTVTNQAKELVSNDKKSESKETNKIQITHTQINI